jgi:hypothetical protein
MAASAGTARPRPQYYQHSGHYVPAQLGVALAAAAAIAILLAAVYAYAILYIPIGGYISFILSGGFGLGLGLSTGMLLRAQKVRNTTVANLAVAGVALLGLWLAWVYWVHAFLGRVGIQEASLFDILVNPLLLGRLIGAVNETGAWSIKNFTPTGFVLAMFWLAEAVLVFVAAALSGVASISSGIFCEDCDEWCEETEGVARLGAQTPTYMRRKLEERDFPFLGKLGQPGAGASEFFRVDIYSCPRCDATHAVVVRHVTITKDKDGKDREETTEIVDKLLVTGAENRWLRAFGEGRPLPSLSGEPEPAAAAAPAARPTVSATAIRGLPVIPAATADASAAAVKRRLEMSSVSAGKNVAIEPIGNAGWMGYRATGARGPRDATEALRFTAARAQPSETGLRVADRAGAVRELAWAQVRDITVIQLPSEPPWQSAIVVDFAPTEGIIPIRLVTGSFIDWKALPGEATSAPMENVRRLCRYALERNPQITLEETTQRFIEGAPCRRLLGMRHFAEYDARYG